MAATFILDWVGRIDAAKKIFANRGKLMAALGAFLTWRWSPVVIFAVLVVAFVCINYLPAKQTTVSSRPEPEPPSEGPMQSAPWAPGATEDSSPPRFSERVDKLFVSIGGNIVEVPNTDGVRVALFGVSNTGGIGLGGMGFANPTAGGTTTAFREGGTIPAVAFTRDHQLFIDAEIFGGPGQPAMHVRHNQLSDRPPRWDRNTDNKHALEIINEQGLPVLQIIYADEGHATIKGIFVNGEAVAIADNGLGVVSQEDVAKYPIKRIFKYPSWKYPGVFEE
jgi:hypothetical protein